MIVLFGFVQNIKTKAIIASLFTPRFPPPLSGSFLSPVTLAPKSLSSPTSWPPISVCASPTGPSPCSCLLARPPLPQLWLCWFWLWLLDNMPDKPSYCGSRPFRARTYDTLSLMVRLEQVSINNKSGWFLRNHAIYHFAPTRHVLLVVYHSNGTWPSFAYFLKRREWNMLRRIWGCWPYLQVTLEPFSFWVILGAYYYYQIRDLWNTPRAGIPTVIFTHVPVMSDWEWLCSCNALLQSNFGAKEQKWVWMSVNLLASMRFKKHGYGYIHAAEIMNFFHMSHQG